MKKLITKNIKGTTYTGVSGEVTIGDNGLRIHDGVTSGGNTVTTTVDTTQVYGPDILNGAGSFTTDDGLWGLGGGWVISGGQASINNTASTLSRVIPVVANTYYCVSWTWVSGLAAFEMSVTIGVPPYDARNLALMPWTTSASFYATTTGNVTFSFVPSGGFANTAVMSNLTIKPIIKTGTSVINAVISSSGTTYSTQVNLSTLNNTAGGTLALTNNLSGNNNTAFGVSALGRNTTGVHNTAIGASALPKSPAGFQNTAVGSTSLGNNITGFSNTAIGYSANYNNISGWGNVSVGTGSLTNNISGHSNVGVGSNTLGTSAACYGNVGVGANAAYWLGANINVTSAITGNKYTIKTVGTTDFTLIGAADNNAGTAFIATGPGTGTGKVWPTSSSNNTAIGYKSLYYKQDGSSSYDYTNCTGLGANTKVSGDNQVQLGDSATTTYVYGTVQNRSDLRDKADVRDTTLGLTFINALRPVDYKWDMRDDYFVASNINVEGPDGNLTQQEVLTSVPRDGSKKRNRFHHGLIAQEVKEVIESSGVEFGGFQDHARTAGGSDVMTIGYDELIAPMIKAIQELSASNKALEAKLTKFMSGK